MLCCVEELETVQDLILEARERFRATNKQIGDAVGVSDQTITNFLGGVHRRPFWFQDWEKLIPVLRVSRERLQAAVENTLRKFKAESGDGTARNVTFNLPPDMLRRLQVEADEAGVTLEAWVHKKLGLFPADELDERTRGNAASVAPEDQAKAKRKKREKQ